MEPTVQQTTLPIACNPDAIPAAGRASHMERAARLLFDTYAERQELPDGYAWRFATEQYEEVAAYVSNERRCCPFFTLSIEVQPGGGPVWLRITGDASVKAYVQAELASAGGATLLPSSD